MTCRMLIVDDEETIRWALSELFMQDGFGVHLAADGDEAIALLEGEPYDYLITDLKMPGRSGIDVVRQARQRNPMLGVTVLTGYATLETAIEAVRLHAWDYATKPCSIWDLKERVDEFLAWRDALRPPRESICTDHPTAALAGEGLRLLTLGEGGAGTVDRTFTAIRELLAHLGLAADRAADLLQCCVDAWASLAQEGDGHGYACLLRGHLVIAMGNSTAGAGRAEQTAGDLAGRYALDVQAAWHEGQAFLVVCEPL